MNAEESDKIIAVFLTFIVDRMRVLFALNCVRLGQYIIKYTYSINMNMNQYERGGVD